MIPKFCNFVNMQFVFALALFIYCYLFISILLLVSRPKPKLINWMLKRRSKPRWESISCCFFFVLHTTNGENRSFCPLSSHYQFVWFCFSSAGFSKFNRVNAPFKILEFIDFPFKAKESQFSINLFWGTWRS